MNRSAFSLVELSIVLVILGLLVGGILGGQSLIKAAELRSIITDKDKYLTAINAFKIKYNALPGDMPNAIDYWGAAHATPATCTTTQGAGTQTCNGDGNGHIGDYDTGSVGLYELFRAWQQMANAGLAEGNYTGIAGSGGVVDTSIGVNIPKSRISGVGYTLFWFGNFTNSNVYPSGYKHVLAFGSEYSIQETAGPAIPPEDAAALDSKIDDGKPGSGSVMSYKATSGNAPGCTSSDTASAAAYVLTTSTNVCALYFKLGF